MLSKRGAPKVDPARWLGIQCGDIDFQLWIGASSTAEAAEIARERCGVESRSEIARSPSALALFHLHIYDPYNEHLRRLSLHEKESFHEHR